MRIECPDCKASGNINEHDIPDEGMYLACPKCAHSFRVDKPRASRMHSVYATNTCPACKYSTFCEEVFDKCPKCGHDVSVEAERKKLQQSQMRQAAAVNAPPSSPIPPPVMPPVGSKYMRSEPVSEKQGFNLNLAGFSNGFEPVAAVGWGIAVIAVILLISGIMGLMDYHGTDIQAALSEKSVEPVSALQVFLGYGLMPWIKTIYGFLTALICFGFLQREEWGLKAMHLVVSATMVLATGYYCVNYTIWIIRSVSPPWWGYVVELLNNLLFMALILVPLAFLLRYINGRDFKRAYNLK
jgi:predicted Zn finger-like uncharacterized protein